MALLDVDYDEVVKGKETVLWTNPSPTSAFASQTVTLSDDITKYDQIKIVYCYNTSSTTSGDDISSVTCEEQKFIKTGTDYSLIPSFSIRHRTYNYYYTRAFIFASNTTITFGSCIQYYLDVAGTVSNAAAIPLKIIGVIEGKIEVNDIKKGNAINWSAVSSNNNQATITNLSKSKWYGVEILAYQSYSNWYGAFANEDALISHSTGIEECIMIDSRLMPTASSSINYGMTFALIKPSQSNVTLPGYYLKGYEVTE